MGWGANHSHVFPFGFLSQDLDGRKMVDCCVICRGEKKSHISPRMTYVESGPLTRGDTHQYNTTNFDEVVTDR